MTLHLRSPFTPPFIATHSTLICLILVLASTNIVLSDLSATASNATAIPVTEEHFSLSELDKFGLVDGVWGKVITNHEMSQYMDPISILKGIISRLKGSGKFYLFSKRRCHRHKVLFHSH